MANLSLLTRRNLVRGIGANRAGFGRRARTGLGNRATLTTAMAGANNDLTLIAKSIRTAGNLVSLTIAVAGNNTPLSVSVSGNDITVASATGAGGAATSTARDVRVAVNNHATAKLLAHVQYAPGNDGTGTVVALAKTNLSGGTATP